MPVETIGRYELESVIGRGAMAVVYKATDPTIGRTVALKTMRFDVHGLEQNEVVSRFRNEARAAGKLLHPNLVTIYDAGEQDGVFYIAMEHVEGTTLHALIGEQRFLPLDQTIDIISQVCNGLDYAHANGVIHRDIKPANIMITRAGVAKVMDFGIAKTSAQLTTGGDVLGTPNYISPEMVKGDAIDGRSDLFSVAVILHEMLLGERPFAAANISSIIYKIVNEPLPPELETKVHPALAAILRKALSKHPSDRYQSGADLSEALRSYQALMNDPLPPMSVVPGTSVPARPMAGPKTPVAPPAASKTPTSATVLRAATAPFAPSPTAPTPPPAASAAKPVPAPVPAPAAPVPPAKAATSPAPTPKPIPPQPVVHNPGTKKWWILALVVLIVVIAGGYFVFSDRDEKTPQGTGAIVPARELEDYRVPDTSRRDQAEAAPVIVDESEAEGKQSVIWRRKTAVPAPTVAEQVAAAPVVTTGDIAISSEPSGAMVQVDGQSRADWKTPFTALGLSAGQHTLTFSKPGYHSSTTVVTVTVGGTVQSSAHLAKAETAIAFSSSPAGASIVLDSIPTGSVTPATVRVSPGEHHVEVTLDGYQVATGNVRIEEGDTQKWSVTLQASDRNANIRQLFGGSKKKGMIQIRSSPPGARVAVEDRVLPAMTPTSVIRNSGRIQVTVSLPGYKPFRREVQLANGDVVTVNVVLEPEK